MWGSALQDSLLCPKLNMSALISFYSAVYLIYKAIKKRFSHADDPYHVQNDDKTPLMATGNSGNATGELQFKVLKHFGPWELFFVLYSETLYTKKTLILFSLLQKSFSMVCHNVESVLCLEVAV